MQIQLQPEPAAEKQDRFIYPITEPQLPYTLDDFQFGIDFYYDSILKREMLSSKPKQRQKVSKLFPTSNMSTCFSLLNYAQKNRTQVKTYQFFKTIRLPTISNDFFNNLLDWSANNVLAIGVKRDVFAWLSYSEKASIIYRSPKSPITSVKFSDNQFLAIGHNHGEIIIRDMVRQCNVRKFKNDLYRIQCMDWSNTMLAVGSQDGYVVFWDIREKDVVDSYKAHQQSIASIKWNPAKNIVASGGGDERLLLFDTRKFNYLVGFQEGNNSIKGIEWCPDNPSIVAAGGGKDEYVHFFSSNTLRHIYSVSTGSPICNLTFSKISNEMITTHSKKSHEFKIWNSKNAWENEEYVDHTGTMEGHRERALHLATNPEGNTIATAASDHTLKLWHPFKIGKSGDSGKLSTADLR